MVCFFFFIKRACYSKLNVRVNIREVSFDKAFENRCWLVESCPDSRLSSGTNTLLNPMEYFNSGASLKNEK